MGQLAALRGFPSFLPGHSLTRMGQLAPIRGLGQIDRPIAL